ncbi:MAG: hypothetical protein OXC10_12230 [Rhodospirillaceae bacterium]|nr:hypothetical protein [Rhodospirillaceae bacterium]
MTAKTARAALAHALPDGNDPPREILLLPAGKVETRPHDSREAWHNPDAEAVVAASRALAADLPVDYEHQGELAKSNGQPAPAAGWIKRVFARDGAVWGEVDWTERAAAMLRGREYRFISPLFDYRKATRAVTRVVGAALTNNPALYMRAIASAQTQETDVKLEDLLKALGLKADAGDDEAIAAAKAAAAAQAALAKIATAFGLADDAGPEAVETAAAAAAGGLKTVAKAAGLAETATPADIETKVQATATAAASADPDSGKFVPREEFDRVAGELTELRDDRATEKATAAVDAAVAEGKISPAQRDWALGRAKADPADFAAYVKTAPAIVTPGRLAGMTGRPARDPDADLDTEELAVCKAMGLAPDKFKAARARGAAQREEAA